MTVILCDDVTGEWACTVTQVGKREVVLTPDTLLRPREPVPDFWLCPALLKKDRFDLMLEKATELGVAEIRPLVTQRCVADKLNGERAKAIVTEAAEQCARTALPVLAEPVKLGQLLRDWPEDRTLFFADELGGEPAAEAFGHLAEFPRRLGPPSRERYPEGDPRLRGGSALLIGPEGGFDEGRTAHNPRASAGRRHHLGIASCVAKTAAMAATAL